MGKEYLPCLAMTIVQVGYAGMNIISKLAMDSGMHPFVTVAYRQVFATITLIPFAYIFERKTRPKITPPILFQIFLSSVLGATMNQCLYFLGLKYSTPTIACALNNLVPAMTFVMAIPFGMETVGIKKRSGQAKVLGTIICVGGAMIMSFYKGSIIKIGESGIHWRYAEHMGTSNSSSSGNSFIGPLFVVASCVAGAAWFIIQTKMSETFAAPYTSSALMCLMATFECGIIGAFADPHIKAWTLAPELRLIAAVYCGVVGSALPFWIMSWTIHKRGPLYVSMFNPLLLVIVAVIGWGILDEKIHMGSAIGSVLIIVGLYSVLWGKGKEENQIAVAETSMEDGKELPVYATSPYKQIDF